jgi:hypothetical protein
MSETQSAAFRAAARNAAAAGDVARRRNDFLTATMDATIDAMGAWAAMDGRTTAGTKRMVDDAMETATEAETDGWRAVESGFREAEAATAAMYAASIDAVETMEEAGE